MFRKIRRIKNEISMEEAKELLRTNKRAAFSVKSLLQHALEETAAEYPYFFCRFVWQNSKLYFKGILEERQVMRVSDGGIR